MKVWFTMPENKSRYPGYTEAQKNAHKKYMERFVEIKVRMTPEKREAVKAFAERAGKSVTEFINDLIDREMKK